MITKRNLEDSDFIEMTNRQSLYRPCRHGSRLPSWTLLCGEEQAKATITTNSICNVSLVCDMRSETSFFPWQSLVLKLEYVLLVQWNPVWFPVLNLAGAQSLELQLQWIWHPRLAFTFTVLTCTKPHSETYTFVCMHAHTQTHTQIQI